MFENVLVGVDGAPNGRDAIALGARLLAEHGSLTLVHVHSGLPSYASRTPPPHAAPTRDQDSVAMLQRERETAQVAAQLMSVTSSSPGRGLHEAAERTGAQLIVVGSCARSLLGRAMLGNDARAALNGAPCAVATAARGYANSPVPLASIGVGYDGSPESRTALAAAREIAARHRSLVRALHVVTLPSYAFTGVAAPSLGETIELMVGDAQADLDKLADVQGRALYGLPGEELASFGEEVDLLVIGSRGYGPVRRLVLGSTSGYLQRHARCSLLVLPRSSATAAAAESPTSQNTTTIQER